MFVLKSTLARVEAERDRAMIVATDQALVIKRQSDQLERMRKDATKADADFHTVANQRDALKAELELAYGTLSNSSDETTLLYATIRKLEEELAKTYVRDAKGRIARHPSAAK